MPPALQSPEEVLVARMILGDGAAWEEMLTSHGGAIAAACRRALAQAGAPCDGGAVADASAEVVRHLLEDGMRLLKRWRSGASLEAYLRVIARSRTLDALRRARPAPSMTAWMVGAEGDPVVEAAWSAERAARVREAMAELRERDAEALRLFHIEGERYAEIGRRLGVPESQVGVVLHRARERLRERLGDGFPESV